MLNFIRNHKIISGVILINVVMVVCLAAAVVIHKNKTATIDIMVAPNDAKILINGQHCDNYSSVDVLPGDYEAEISMDGMQTRKVNFSLEDDGFYRLRAYLLDANGGFDYYRDAKEDYEALVDILPMVGEEAQDFVRSMEGIRAINGVLPLVGWEYDNPNSNFSTSLFRIIDGKYDDKCTKAACLLVQWYRGKPVEDSVNEKIVAAGFSPDDYQIVYEEMKYEEEE